MQLALIEKKNKPVVTKFSFTKKEWERLPQYMKEAFEKASPKTENSRYVHFYIDGDCINNRTKGDIINGALLDKSSLPRR